VLVTISDKKIGVSSNGTTIDYYNADVVTANDYYPFGMTMPGRKYSNSAGAYRYGFNGKEKDNSTGNDSYDYGARIYDGRIGRWLSVDGYAVKYPNFSPYSFCINSPLQYKDANGNWLVDKDGNIIFTIGKVTYERKGNEIIESQLYYFYTNDGQAVEAVFYRLKGKVDNVEWADEAKTKFLDFKDRDKLEVFDNTGNPECTNCHGNSLNFRPGLFDYYVAGLDEEGRDNVSKIYKNKAEFTPVRAEDVKPGDIAIFEDDKGNIQHSATITKASKKEKKVRLTSKDDRKPIERNQSIKGIKKNPNYKNFAGYYRKNADKKVDVEVNGQGTKGYAGEPDGEEIKKILEEAKKNE